MSDLPIAAPRESFHYTQEQKDDFLLAYLETGKLTEACRKTGVGYETSKQWKNQEWFQSALVRLRNERNKELDQRYTKILDVAAESLLDRLENGEERITKSGEVVVVKPGLAAVTMAMGVTYDKRALLRGESGIATETTALEKIEESLRKLVRNQKQPAIEAETVVYVDNPRS